MRRPDPTARQVLSLFASTDLQTRVHSTGRWWSCPFAALEALIPRTGRVLDFGCGFGHFSMYLALRSPDRMMTGVDIDAAKIVRGQAAVERAGLGGRVGLVHVDADWLPEPGAFDAVVTVDVLYLMGERHATKVLDSMVTALSPGGRIVVKEMAARPRWKYRVNAAQERLATGALGLTQGAELSMLSRDQIERPLRDRGMRVHGLALDRGYVHPHLAVVGEG